MVSHTAANNTRVMEANECRGTERLSRDGVGTGTQSEDLPGKRSLDFILKAEKLSLRNSLYGVVRDLLTDYSACVDHSCQWNGEVRGSCRPWLSTFK